MKYIFIINGRSGAGKDEFIKFVKGFSLRFVENISSVEPIKNIFSYLDVKDRSEEQRNSMATIKSELDKFGFTPNFLSHKVAQYYNNVIFYHERSWENIQKLKALKVEHGNEEYKVVSVFVDREIEGEVFDNDADKNATLNKDKYDIIINNNKTLRELKNLAHQFCKKFDLN